MVPPIFRAVLSVFLVAVSGARRPRSPSSRSSTPSPAHQNAFEIRGGASADSSSKAKLVVGVDGGTESIRACCFDAENGEVVGKPFAVPYVTDHPNPGWAEQNPKDWYENLGEAVRSAVRSIPPRLDHEVMAICVDTTCCSVVALDEAGEALRPCLLWMDQRAAKQTEEIMKKCKGDPALGVNCGGRGPISAEWLLPKALWVRQTEPEIWDAAATICEYEDYINYKLTGVMCASSCNAASRWHWDGSKCTVEDERGEHPGRPLSLYKKLGVPELAEKLPQKCLPMGAVIGGLTPEAAKHLGLPEGLPVVQGGPDAFVGMVGLGCIHPGQLCLITGSSHLHCAVTSKPQTSWGVWGAYKGAPLPGINLAEGGQSSTGSIIRWARSLFGADDVEYKLLDEEAAQIVPGSDGLVALETFQGSRTPVTDPLARGALMGLTLSHTRAHIWRSLMEAVCFGTRACVDALEAAGHNCDEIIIAGGATRSDLWLQMHADVSGKPVIVCENADAPLLGCAVLASVGVGLHKTFSAAVQSMVRTTKRVEPEPDTSSVYNTLYEDIYKKVADAARSVVHAIQKKSAVDAALGTRGGGTTSSEYLDSEEQEAAGATESDPANAQVNVVISPSLLACDWAAMRDEVHRCLSSGATRLHVDIFDGVFLDSPLALTFGPQMVHAIRRSCESFRGVAILDLHMCVDRPVRFIAAMAEAGADRFIFQWEAVDSIESAMELAVEVNGSMLSCGVSINPETDVEELFPLLSTNLVDLVDVLAVKPGFGGQPFQHHVLEKVRKLREWRETNMVDFEILVDGGINDETARGAIEAGADILVSGSFLFDHPKGVAQGVKDLLKDPSTS